MTWIDRPSCPVCGSGAGRQRYACAYAAEPLRSALIASYAAVGAADPAAVADGEYRLLDCPGCGLVWQRWAPGPALALDLYERWIDPNAARERHRLASLDEHRALARDVAALLDGFARPPGEVRVLDFAAGWSAWALMARAHGAVVAISELSPARGDHAKSLGLAVVDPAHSGPFDLIHADQVFEHLGDPLAELVRLAGLLSPARGSVPGGRIRLRVPNGRDIDRRLRAMDWQAVKGSRRSLNLVAPLEHLNCFRPRSLRRLAACAGLRQVRRSIRSGWRSGFDPATPARLAQSLVRPIWDRLPWTTDLLLERIP